MLPRLSLLDCEALPPSWARRASNFDRELAPWFRVAAMRAIATEIAAPHHESTAQHDGAWPDEPPSARIPFLIF